MSKSFLVTLVRRFDVTLVAAWWACLAACEWAGLYLYDGLAFGVAGSFGVFSVRVFQVVIVVVIVVVVVIVIVLVIVVVEHVHADADCFAALGTRSSQPVVGCAF